MEKLKSTLARTEGRADQLQDALRESERVHQLAMKEGNKKETAAESPPTLTLSLIRAALPLPTEPVRP